MTFIAKRDCNWNAGFSYSFKKGEEVAINEIDIEKAIASGIFEITKNDMDRVKSCDIQDFLKRKNINMSMAKISNYLTNRGCIHGPHKFSGKVCKGFKGLRQIEIGNIDE